MKSATGGASDLEERILVLAPTGRDATLAEQTLCRAGLEAEVIRTPEELASAIDRGAAAILLAEEALSPLAVDVLAGALERQAPWSDLPLVVFAGAMDRQASSARLEWMSSRLGNVTLVERPVRVATLVTAVRAALRARHRQYAARATMKALEAREEEGLRLPARDVRRRDAGQFQLGHVGRLVRLREEERRRVRADELVSARRQALELRLVVARGVRTGDAPAGGGDGREEHAPALADGARERRVVAERLRPREEVRLLHLARRVQAAFPARDLRHAGARSGC